MLLLPSLADQPALTYPFGECQAPFSEKIARPRISSLMQRQYAELSCLLSLHQSFQRPKPLVLDTCICHTDFMQGPV